MTDIVQRVPKKGMKRQTWFATAGQTAFTVTDFPLDDYYSVSENGAMTSQAHTRTNQTVTFAVARLLGDEISIYN